MPELLPLAGRVATAAFQFGYWLASKLFGGGGPDLSGVAAAINAVWEGLRVTVSSIVRVRDLDVTWARIIGNDINDMGGAIEEIGNNQHDLWHHLRYTLMPGTINLIENQVWTAWIRPLRSHLGYLIFWDREWHTYTRAYAWQLKNWAHDLLAAQRGWRARFVYPQIRWLMSPRRVAYHYAQAILTEISQYLAIPEHHQDRDAITRTVISNSPRLWRYLDTAILQFLQTEIGPGGYGSALPQRPAGAKEPPPPVPPIWEPWSGAPSLTPWPSDSPNLPEQDRHYDGGYIGIQ